MTKNWKKELFSIPNILSFCRLIMIPVYTTIYLHATQPRHYLIAASILALSCLTDMADGKIARKFNMITNIGKILDPIADKATQITLIVCLAIRYPILWILCALFLIKETFQTVAGLITLKSGRMLSGALMSGKICTAILFISLTVLVLLPGIPYVYVQLITALNCVFLLLAFFSYGRAYYLKKSEHFQNI